MPLLMVLRMGLWGRICFCKSIWLSKEQKVSLYSFWRKSGSRVLCQCLTRICTLRSKRLNTQKRERRILVSLHIYDASKATKEINLGKYNDFILPAWNGQMMQMSYQRRC
jgi:hypothetical protein